MSRSNPTDQMPNPSARWFEWNGENGHVKYYDKTLAVKGKEKPGGDVTVPLPFTFLVLDELVCVKGWHDSSQSGIVSNEVHNTKLEPLAVRAFKGGPIASGFYGDIKDKVKAAGGKFTASIYIGYKTASGLEICNLQFHGGAVGAWMEFTRACPFNKEKKCKEYLVKAVKIGNFVVGKKGSVTFRNPVFTMIPVSDEMNVAAAKLDFELQEYLKAYLEKTRMNPALVAAASESAPPQYEPDPYDAQPSAPSDEEIGKLETADADPDQF